MDNYIELRQIISILKRGWWVLVLGLLIGAVVGYGISQSQSRVYEATATVMVGESIQAQEISRDDIAAREVFAQTYAELARRQTVLGGVIDALNLDVSLGQLKDRVQVKIVETQMIEITAQSDTPQEAQLIAGEVAHQLVLLSPDQQNQDSTQLFLQQEIDNLQARIESGRKKLLILQAETASVLPAETASALPAETASALPAETASALLAEQLDAKKTEIDTLERLIADWEDTYSRLLGLVKPNTSQNRLTILEEAQANPKPVHPNPPLNILLGVGLGFVLALGIIFLINQFDNRVRSAEVLEQKFGLGYLGSISKMVGENFDGKLIVTQDPLSNISESYRMVKRNIEFITKGQKIKSLLITSANRGEGKSITVSNLGIIMAQAGLKTIIVDANLRESTQHLIFDVPNGIGLANLLTNLDLKPKEQLIDTGIANLQLLTSGNLPHNPAELLHDKRIKQILFDLSKLSDLVILDASSLANSESVELSNHVDGVVLVIDFGRTTQTSIEQSMTKLHLASGRLLGGVLNRSHP